MATAFQTSPYRHPTVGWMADLERMQASELNDWYQQWYAPNNATVVVVGDVEPQEVYALAKKYFAGLSAEKISSNVTLPETPQQGIKRITVKRPAEVPYLLMVYKVPVLKTAIDLPDQVQEWEPYALDVLAGVLDGGGSARFASRLVRGKEIATSVGAGYSFGSRLDNVFVISGTPSRGKSTVDLEQAIKQELTEIRENLVDAKELDRVKAQVVSSDVYEKDSVFYQGMILGLLETVGLSWRHADEYVARIQAITAEQVQAVAKKYFIDDRLTVAMLDPQPMQQQQHSAARAGGRHAH